MKFDTTKPHCFPKTRENFTRLIHSYHFSVHGETHLPSKLEIMEDLLDNAHWKYILYSAYSPTGDLSCMPFAPEPHKYLEVVPSKLKLRRVK